MGLATPVPKEKRDEVLRLAREGVARNEIARQTGVSTASVTRIASDEDIDFDRSATEAAVKARVADMKAARVSLAAGLLDDVGAARTRMHGSEDNRAFLDGARAVAALVGSHVRVAVVDRDDTAGVDEARSMLGKLARGIAELAVAEGGEDGEAP
ncbi:hypothetical protein [Streptomyces sp. NPDC056821]|uniref:hypothetical protein n=1 Tax=unclassified Streptomyces TaxID=2593676 RepID=UPI0036B3E814